MRRPTPHHHSLSRALRHHPTAAEKVLWQRLRLRGLGGMKFRQQHAIGPFIVDFCCPSARLVVEVDGADHGKRRKQDMRRTM